jgi:hypothetical protein
MERRKCVWGGLIARMRLSSIFTPASVRPQDKRMNAQRKRAYLLSRLVQGVQLHVGFSLAKVM